MDDIHIGPTIGRTALLILGLLLLLLAGAGVAMAILMRHRTMGMMRGGGCPCMAMLRGDDRTRM